MIRERIRIRTILSLSGGKPKKQNQAGDARTRAYKLFLCI